MTDTVVQIFRGKVDLSFIDVRPGDWVVIKPNLVKEHRENDPSEWRSVITDPDLIRVVTEYVAERVTASGRISLCDGPQTDSSFQRIAERLRLRELAEFVLRRYGVSVELIDLRDEEWISEGGVVMDRRPLPGDPEGTVVFNLGRNSAFYGFHGEGRYYGADYDTQVVNAHHCGEVQEYRICATPIKADVFINLPKMKTHKKAGVTLNMKNLVGINADKNWLPHHTVGSPANGGDEFPDERLPRKLERLSVRTAHKLALSLPWLGPRIARELRKAGTAVFGSGHHVIRSGNWYGNDTVWRMVLDLNRCLLYGQGDGRIDPRRSKRYFCVVDGRIGMEGMGPMQGDPIESGVVVGGTDPAAVDLVCARIMGFDWNRIPTLREALRLPTLPITSVSLTDIQVRSDCPDWNGSFTEIQDREFLRFRPHFGWKGHIEFPRTS